MPSKPAKRPARRPARKSTPPAEPPAQPLVDATVGGPVASRPRTFLVARDDTILAPAALGDLDFGFLVEQLDLDPRVRVEARLIPRTFSAQSLGTSITDEVIVATMSEEAAADLSLHPQVILEEDSLVVPTPAVAPKANADPGLVSPFGASTSWTIVLSGAGQEPVPDAAVYLYGSGVPVQGRTDATGTVTLSLIGETDATLRALYVNPLAGFWSLWVDRPQLVSGTANSVQLTPLAASFPGFPRAELVGWGQRAMRLDLVPPALTGAGVKVAVVDSGAAAQTHPDLLAIHDGADFHQHAERQRAVAGGHDRPRVALQRNHRGCPQRRRYPRLRARRAHVHGRSCRVSRSLTPDPASGASSQRLGAGGLKILLEAGSSQGAWHRLVGRPATRENSVSRDLSRALKLPPSGRTPDAQ